MKMAYAASVRASESNSGLMGGTIQVRDCDFLFAPEVRATVGMQDDRGVQIRRHHAHGAYFRRVLLLLLLDRFTRRFNAPDGV